MAKQSINFADYIEILKRRKFYIIGVWMVITLVALLIALKLPKVFRSTATLLIQSPMPTKLTEVPNNLLMADDQVQTLYQRVLTTENILKLINKHKLYKENIDDQSKFELVDIFKANAEVELANTNLLAKNAKLSEIVFYLSFKYGNPSIAKDVTDELAQLLIDQNDQGRTQRANKVASFLMDELAKLSQQTEEIDRKIANYKELHSSSLPEQVQTNLLAVDRLEMEVKETDTLISGVKEKLTFLSTQLAQVKSDTPDFNPSSGTTAPTTQEEAIKALRTQYFQLSGIYSPNHPTMLQLKHKLQSLEGKTGLKVDESEIKQQLAEAKAELTAAEKVYTATHPDLVKIKKRIASLEKQLVNANRLSIPRETTSRTPNPVYLNLQLQYKNSQSELDGLLHKQSFLQNKLDRTRDVLAKAPQIEIEYNDLIRERESTAKKYNQVKEKWLDAQFAQAAEEEQKGQTLTVLEPARYPYHPEKADRKKVVLGGFFFGLLAGIMLALLLEYVQPGVRGSRSVAKVTGLSPLVVIPYLDTPVEELEKLVNQISIKKKILWVLLIVTMITLVLATVLVRNMGLNQ